MAVTHEDLNQVSGEPESPVEPQAAEHEDEYEGYSPPTGAFLFVLVMLVGYAIYWLLTYSELVIARSGS